MARGSEARGRYVGAMMRLVWQWVRDDIAEGVIAAGYVDLNPAHIGLFRYPTLDRLRPSEIAEQMQITKQSVNELLGHLEARGYLVRAQDPRDGRARIVRLTARGRRLEQVINRRAEAAELRIADVLGPRRFAQLHDALEALADSVLVDDLSSPADAIAARR